MPQGRRKTPFSGKAKKEQLKVKKQAKAGLLDPPGKFFRKDYITAKIQFYFHKKRNQRNLY